MSSRRLLLLNLLAAFGVGCGSGAHPGGSVGTSGGGGVGGAGTTGASAGTTGSEAGATGSTAGTTGAAGNDNMTGTGGTTPSGGATGAAGAAGNPGAAGTAAATGAGGGVAAGGATGAGGRPSGPSAGCNMSPPLDDPIGSGILRNMTITGLAQEYVAGYTDRTYCSTTPKNYDPTTPYPLVIYGPGCGGQSCEGGPFSGRSDIFLVQATKAPKVYNGQVPPVPPAAAPGCFQTGVISTVDSPELNYFDQLVAEIESKYCIDKARVFVAGSSSGGWFSNYLGCARGNVIRGIAADSGGIPFAHPACTGGAAAMEFPGDSANDKDSMGNPNGVAVARDLFIKTNGCNTTPTQMKFGNTTCDYYGGCSSPVAWCDTGGGHQAGLGYINPDGWPFWMMLQ
jgi:polyhydroxybutyrate depolymerase